MANLYGFELKSMKTYRGHEGEPLAQGNVYYNGKKLGFWSQDDWGGLDRFEFDTTPFDDAINECLSDAKEFADWKEHNLNIDLSALLGKLATLKDTEKIYKKFAKDGAPTMYEANDGYNAIMFASEKPASDAMKAKVLAEAARKLKNNASELELNVYESVYDFSIGSPVIIDRKVVKGIVDETKAREARRRALYAKMK